MWLRYLNSILFEEAFALYELLKNCKILVECTFSSYIFDYETAHKSGEWSFSLPLSLPPNVRFSENLVCFVFL